jgi:NADPH:quinone reductase-like Zn-dependent oxidoreductase
MESQQTIDNEFVAMKDGKYVLQKNVISAKAAPGHILVKMAYSTVDPYDFLCYTYHKGEDLKIGVEGSGTVISVGEGVDSSLNGKKIAYMGNGAWSRYVELDVTKNFIMVLDDSQDLSKAAAACVNPLTAIAQLIMIKDKPSKGFIADAAASSLNKMLLQLVQKDNTGIQGVGIVRKEAQAQFLKDTYGCKHVLIQDSASFDDDLKKAVEECEPKVFFDVVGGAMPMKVFKAMPNGSEMVIVANLTHTDIPFDSYHILFSDKRILPLLVFPWMATATEERRNWAYKQVSDDLGKNEGHIFGTNFAVTVDLKEWETAVRDHNDVASK